MATASEILNTFPEFVDIDEATKTLYIELATCQTSTTVFGCSYQYAIALRAAHNLSVTYINGSLSGGAIVSKTEGDLTIRYSNNRTSYSAGSDLSTTNYGRILADLINGSVITPMVSGVDNG